MHKTCNIEKSTDGWRIDESHFVFSWELNDSGMMSYSYQICNFIFFPSISIVLILKSIPTNNKNNTISTKIVRNNITHTWFSMEDISKLFCVKTTMGRISQKLFDAINMLDNETILQNYVILFQLISEFIFNKNRNEILQYEILH